MPSFDLCSPLFTCILSVGPRCCCSSLQELLLVIDIYLLLLALVLCIAQLYLGDTCDRHVELACNFFVEQRGMPCQSSQVPTCVPKQRTLFWNTGPRRSYCPANSRCLCLYIPAISKPAYKPYQHQLRALRHSYWQSAPYWHSLPPSHPCHNSQTNDCTDHPHRATAPNHHSQLSHSRISQCTGPHPDCQP